MLVNELAGQTRNYKRELKIRLTLFIVMFLWGALTFVIAVVVSKASTVAALRKAGIPVQVLSPRMQSFYMGFGAGFTAVLLVAIFATLYLLFNNKAQERRKVRDHDERNMMIQQKAGMMTAAITIMVGAFALIIAGVFNPTVMFTLIWMVILMGVVYFVCLFIFRLRS